MVIVDVQNLTASSIDEKFVAMAIRETLRQVRIRGTMSIGVVIAGSATIRKLNKKYNNADKATDVLSFGSSRQFITPSYTGKYLGEIIVCPAIVRKNAFKFRVSFMKEFTHVVIHGTLHLMGYKHEDNAKKAEEMHEKEEEIMDTLKV